MTNEDLHQEVDLCPTPRGLPHNSDQEEQTHKRRRPKQAESGSESESEESDADFSEQTHKRRRPSGSESESEDADFSDQTHKRRRPKQAESGSESDSEDTDFSDQEEQTHKKRRPKQAESDKKKRAAATEQTIHLYERWNFGRLAAIAELVLDPATESVVGSVYADLKTTKSTRLRVSYTSRGEFKQGRVYGKGLQGVKGTIRRLCAGEYYHDIDMANCSPTLLCQILKKHGLCPEILEEYANDRAAVFERLRTSDNRLCNVSDKALKRSFLLGVHGGKHKNYLQEYLNFPDSDKKPVPELEEWETRLGDSLRTLRKKSKFHKKLWKQINMSKGKTNPKGTFASWCWQIPENEIIVELNTYFNKELDYTPGALIFDGLLLERKDGVSTVPDAMLRRAETHIRDTLGWQITLVEKPIQPTAEDWEFYWGERSLQKMSSNAERLIYLLWWTGQGLKAVRSGDQVMVPHRSIPGVYVPHMAASKFINHTLKDKHAFTSVPMTQLLAWFEQTDHPRFPLVTKDSFAPGVISFTNGFLNIITSVWTQWEELEGDAPMTDHYFEQDLPLGGFDHPTPLFDSILETQIKCERTRDVIEAMIGRLFFPIGLLDNWQLCLLILGDSNTGKGTLLKGVTQMFPPKSVGAITAGKEASFGYESLHRRRLVVIPDMPSNFSKVLHQQDFQSMISGEPVSIARKNKVAVTDEDWKVPILGATNIYPDYKDESGSISRRLLVVPFTTLVKGRDTTLLDRIVKDELVLVMLRCLEKYRQLREQIGTDEPWKHMPPTLLKAREDVKTNTSPLASFLKDGDSRCQILFKEGHITPLQALNKAFSNYMRFTHKKEKVAGIGSDYFPLKSAGFQVNTVKICKTCGKKASKDTCGDHYSSKNRANKVVVENMEILDLSAF